MFLFSQSSFLRVPRVLLLSPLSKSWDTRLSAERHSHETFKTSWRLQSEKIAAISRLAVLLIEIMLCIAVLSQYSKRLFRPSTRASRYLAHSGNLTRMSCPVSLAYPSTVVTHHRSTITPDLLLTSPRISKKSVTRKFRSELPSINMPNITSAQYWKTDCAANICAKTFAKPEVHLHKKVKRSET